MQLAAEITPLMTIKFILKNKYSKIIYVYLLLVLFVQTILLFFVLCTEQFTCMMSEWISWSPCSVSCGMGMRSRERYIKEFPEDSSLCQHQIEETEKCVVNDECCESIITLEQTQMSGT